MSGPVDSREEGELKELKRTWDFAEADIIKSFLESQGIPCLVKGEAIGQLYRIMTDGLGELRILVPGEHLETAQKLLEERVEIPDDV
ncbi:MAG: DUF2007 domain-containing protein [Candidatus Aminicenantes bacterium]|nr:DUF2007 domain-containing protein [Candidatus Aminicenantes bacterium]